MVLSSFRGATDRLWTCFTALECVSSRAHDINASVEHCACPRALWAATQRHWGDLGRDSGRVPARVRPLSQAQAGGRSLVCPPDKQALPLSHVVSDVGPSEGRRPKEARQTETVTRAVCPSPHDPRQVGEGQGGRRGWRPSLTPPRCAKSTLHGE